MRTTKHSSKESQQVDLSSLVKTIPISVEGIQIAESVQRTVIEKSDKRGESVQEITEDRPFELKLKIAPNAALKKLGFKHSADDDVLVSLYDKGGQPRISAEHQYSATEYRQREREVVDYHVRAGEEIAPYCYARESYDVYKTVYESDPVSVTRTEQVATDLKKEGFNLVFASLLQQATEGNATASEALERLEEAFPSRVKTARQAINKAVSSELKKVEEKAAALTKNAEAINKLKLPGAFPDA